MFHYTVPVVVVFTKYDALLDQVANDLEIINMTEQNKAAVHNVAEARYREHYHLRITETAYPPKAVVKLQGKELFYFEHHYSYLQNYGPLLFGFLFVSLMRSFQIRFTLDSAITPFLATPLIR